MAKQKKGYWQSSSPPSFGRRPVVARGKKKTCLGMAAACGAAAFLTGLVYSHQ